MRPPHPIHFSNDVGANESADNTVEAPGSYLMTYRILRVASDAVFAAFYALRGWHHEKRRLSAGPTSPPLDSRVFAEQLYDAVVAVPLDELGNGTTHNSAIGHVSASD